MSRFAVMSALALANVHAFVLAREHYSFEDLASKPRPVAKPKARPESPCETFGARQRRRYELRKGK